MPIYVYQAKDPAKGCAKCAAPFETIQSLREAPLAACPDCGAAVERLQHRRRTAGEERESRGERREWR